MDARERYLWDLNGYLVVKGVLTDAEIAAANEVIDRYSEQIKLDAVGVRSRDSETLQGTGRPTLSGFLEMERPYCDPYRALLAHPALVYRLNVMMGKGFRLDHGPLLIGGAKGTEGLTMHGSGEPHRPMVAYQHQNGETYVGGVTVTWYLADANAGDHPNESPEHRLPESGFVLERHVRTLEREYLARALQQAGGVKVRAAGLLGMSFRSFRYYAKKYDLG